MDGIAKHIEIRGFQIDVVQIEVGIIHEAVGRFQRIGTILVPQKEINVFQRDTVDDNRHGLRLFFPCRVGRSESVQQKSEIHLVFALIGNQIGLRVAQLDVVEVDYPLQKVADADFRPQRANLRQVVLFQVFD